MACRLRAFVKNLDPAEVTEMDVQALDARGTDTGGQIAANRLIQKPTFPASRIITYTPENEAGQQGICAAIPSGTDETQPDRRYDSR